VVALADVGYVAEFEEAVVAVAAAVVVVVAEH